MRIRSKSENDFFDHKESLDVLHGNFSKFQYKFEDETKRKNKGNPKTQQKIKQSQEQTFFKKILNVKENLQENLETNKLLKGSALSKDLMEKLELKKKEVKRERKFKEFLKLVLNFRNDLNSIFLHSKISKEKNFLNTILDLALSRLIELKWDLVAQIRLRTDKDEGVSKSISLAPNKSLLENNFDNLILLILTLRKMNSSFLYRESKVAIFKSYHNLVSEIKNDLSKNLMEIDPNACDVLLKRFRFNSQAVIFFFTNLNIKLDYYQITLNTLMGKLNSYFTHFIKYSKSQFLKTLVFLVNYIKLKESYMEEFNSSGPTEMASDDIFMCKFLSFSHFFFSNMYDILDKINMNCQPCSSSNALLPEQKKYYFLLNKKIRHPDLGLTWRSNKFHKSKMLKNKIPKSKNGKEIINTMSFNFNYGMTNTIPINSTTTHSQIKNSIDNQPGNPDKYYEFNRREISNTKNDINSHFRTYYNSKLAQWKFLVIDSTKPQTCRICEDVFNFNDYVMHAAFCREHRNNLQLLSNFNTSLSRIILSIKDYRIVLEKNHKKSYLLSPRSCYTSLFKLKQIEKQISSFDQALPKETDPNIIDFLITILEKEKNKDITHYEENPDRLDSLNKLILSSLKIYIKNDLIFRENDSNSNKLFGNLFSILMKKQIVIEKILTYYETMGFLHRKRGSNTGVKLLSFKYEGRRFRGALSSNCVLDIDRYKDVLTKMNNIFNNHPLSNSSKYKKNVSYFYSSSSRSVSENSERFSDKPPISDINANDQNQCNKKLSKFYCDSDKIKNVSSKLKEISKLAELNPTDVIVEEYNEADCHDYCIPKLNIVDIDKGKQQTIISRNLTKLSLLSTPNFQQNQAGPSGHNSCRGKHYSSLWGGSIFSDEEERDKKPSVNFAKFLDHMNIDDLSMQRIENECDEGEYDDIFNLLVEVEMSQKNSQAADTAEEIDRAEANLIASPSNKYNKDGNLLVQISDFTMILKLSKGGYGTVELYKKNSTGDYYAIKKVSILKMKTRKSYNLLKNEMQILSQIRNEFVVKIFFLLRDKIHYYFVMEFVPGGDMLGFLNTYIPTTEIIRHFVCEIILGLEYLHKIGIIHRDIKPENIVLDKAGHIKITDFGISQLTNGDDQEKSRSDSPQIENHSSDDDDVSPIIPKKTKINLKLNNIKDLNSKPPSKTLTVDHNNRNKSNKSSLGSNESQKIVGTDNYIAPEVLNFKPITKAVDLWALGVMIFEMVTGKLPFNAEDSDTIRKNIKEFNINWEFLEESIENREGPPLDVSVVDLIKSLIVEDPEKRLGYANILDLKMHPFLKDWNWLNPSVNKEPHIINYVHQQVKNLSNQIKENKVARAIKTLKSEELELVEGPTSSINISIIPALNDKNHDVIKEHVGKGLANMNGLIRSDII